MPINGNKVSEIIREEVQSIRERCPGYREELEEAILEIIGLEWQHQIRATSIRQKVSGRCKAAGRWLAVHTQDIPGVPDGA